MMRNPRTALVTGAAGFIGSNLAETLLNLGQHVIALDNFSTGHRRNLEEAGRNAGEGSRLTVVEGDIRDIETCRKVCRDVEIVFHQAALGSVPASIADPLTCHSINVNGFVNMIEAARQAGVKRFVYASSSAVYGDSRSLSLSEDEPGMPISPYALSKMIDEQYADVFHRTYDFTSIGLRYFNVFGKRQDPDGPYAAVIPKWIDRMSRGLPVEIYGDGTTSRDFCHVDNIVEMNILAATTSRQEAFGKVYNGAIGKAVTLDELYETLVQGLVSRGQLLERPVPVRLDFRSGDIRHSRADITRAKEMLGYEPSFDFASGLEHSLDWYLRSSAENVSP